MSPRDGERRYKHSHTAQQENGTRQGTTSSPNNRAMLMKYQDKEKARHHGHANCLDGLKRKMKKMQNKQGRMEEMRKRGVDSEKLLIKVRSPGKPKECKERCPALNLAVVDISRRQARGHERLPSCRKSTKARAGHKSLRQTSSCSPL